MRAAIVVAALALCAAPARADDSSYRSVIDRADLEPDTLGGLRLRVYLSAVAVQGQLLDVSEPKAIRAVVGGSRLEAPYATGAYGATTADTAIVFVVESTAAYGDVLPVITDALGNELLGSLGDKTTQIAFLPYGDAIGTGKLTAMKAGRAKLAQLSSDGSTEDPALLETVERALLLLKREKAAREGKPFRELIVVIGDGRDRVADRDRVIKVGKRAAADGVRIHTLGFSPTDTRRPLLLLGELSKRSLGTFRWVRGAKADSWAASVGQLRDEIAHQNVVTFFLPEDADVGGKKLKIQTVGRTETTSNEVLLPAAPSCGSATCDSGAYCLTDRCVTPETGGGGSIFGFLIKLVLGAVGLLAVLVGIGFVLSKRAETRVKLPPGGPSIAPRPAIPPGAYGAAQPAVMPARPPAPAPAVLPNGKPAPVFYLMGGQRDGQRVTLRHGFTIGKAPTCDLVIDDGFTSSVHAQMSMDQFGNCRIYDNNSTNGLYVNGVRVADYALSHGVSVKIGSTEMRFLAQ
jgi:hypothetical protein